MTSSTIPFVQARNYTHGRSNPIDLIVIHTMESPEKPDTAESVAAWFAGPNAPQASAHYCIDADSIVACVRDTDVAWHAPGANHNGLGLEHAGRAAQSAAEWNDDYSSRLLDLSSELVAQKCAKYDIPAVWLSPAQLRAGKRGITGHVQVSEAFKRSDHTDPGKSFPVEAYIARVREHLGHAFVQPEQHHWRHKAPAQTPMLRVGDEGYQVKRLQKLLAERGYDAGQADGIFGPHTLAAVKQAQVALGLDDDGIAGPLTWAALLAA